MDRSPTIATILLLAIAMLANPTHADDREAAVASAMATLDAFMASFNDRDMTAWAATLHYPHVRFASGTVRVWPDAESFIAESPFEALAAIGWDRSRWASREVRLMDTDKIHIETVFERLDANGDVLWTFPSLHSGTTLNPLIWLRSALPDRLRSARSRRVHALANAPRFARRLFLS